MPSTFRYFKSKDEYENNTYHSSTNLKLWGTIFKGLPVSMVPGSVAGGLTAAQLGLFSGAVGATGIAGATLTGLGAIPTVILGAFAYQLLKYHTSMQLKNYLDNKLQAQYLQSSSELPEFAEMSPHTIYVYRAEKDDNYQYKSILKIDDKNIFEWNVTLDTVQAAQVDQKIKNNITRKPQMMGADELNILINTNDLKQYYHSETGDRAIKGALVGTLAGAVLIGVIGSIVFPPAIYLMFAIGVVLGGTLGSTAGYSKKIMTHTDTEHDGNVKTPLIGYS